MIDELHIRRRRFSRTFFRIQEARTRHVVIYGGAASSKSYSAYQFLIMDIMDLEGKGDFLVMRKHAADMFVSVYSGIKAIIEDWNIGFLFEFKYSNDKREIVYTPTGRKMIFRGMDDPEKIKSIVNIKRVVMEEANQFDFKDIRELNRRARGLEGIQLFYLFNPVIETHWLKIKLFDEKVFDDITYIHCTYKDNRNHLGEYFITDEDISALEALKGYDENEYNVYALGNWGQARTGMEFFKGFDSAKHVRAVAYDPDLPVHISVDENVAPYCAITAWQIERFHDGRYEVRQVAELPARDPYNTASGAGKTVVKYLRSIGYGGTVWLYGDPSTRSRSTVDDNKRSFLQKFTAVIREDYEVQERFFSSAPSVALTGDFINALYSGGYNTGGYKIDIQIAEECRESIQDYRLTRQDKDGSILKRRVKDKETGLSYEPEGHLSDTKRYFICKAFEDDFDRFRNRHGGGEIIVQRRKSFVR